MSSGYPAEEIIHKKTTSLELAAVKISTDGKGFTAPWKRKEYNTLLASLHSAPFIFVIKYLQR